MFILFLILATYIVVENFGLAACQAWLARQHSGPRWLGAAWYAWAFFMNALFLIEVIDPTGWKPFLRHYVYLPMAVEMVWNLLLVQVFFPLSLLAVIIVRMRHSRRKMPAPEPAGMSRRKFLYLVGCGAVPATAIGMGVYGGINQFDLRTRSFTIPIANLPPELEGFTIAHVSDLHSGLFVGPRRLKIIADATNDLKADLVALTGDIINREMNEFPTALAAIQRMESKHGLFVCEGNHDLLPGPGVVMNACAANKLSVLYNSCFTLEVRGQRLLLGGLAWERINWMDTYPSMVRDLFPAREAHDVHILFAHHPHLFDIAQSADLVLSGHTHGGQIMLDDNVGLGRLRFKYCSGLFQRGNTSMVVSNGAGDWFPCRINAPAEIGLLTLTRAKTA